MVKVEIENGLYIKSDDGEEYAVGTYQMKKKKGELVETFVKNEPNNHYYNASKALESYGRKKVLSKDIRSMEEWTKAICETNELLAIINDKLTIKV